MPWYYFDLDAICHNSYKVLTENIGCNMPFCLPFSKAEWETILHSVAFIAFVSR